MRGNWPSCYNHVFSRLEGVMGGANQHWDAFCPNHDDGKRSLSVSIGREGRLIMKCHAPAACPTVAIARSIGCTLEDFYTDNRYAGGPSPSGNRTNQQQARQRMQFLKAYDYRDEQGKVLMQVVRWDPKHFTQRRPNAAFNPSLPRDKERNPEFLNDTANVRRVLYRLPEILSAIKANPNRWLFIVEGEKDVDLAWANGIIATTCPMGAGKWKGHGYEETLRDCNVCVIGDEDPLDPKTGVRAGRKHAEEVCQALAGVAKQVKLLRLPLPWDRKMDFSDWWGVFADDVTPDQRRKALGVLVKDCPAFDPAAPSLAAEPTPELSPTEKAAAMARQEQLDHEQQQVEAIQAAVRAGTLAGPAGTEDDPDARAEREAIEAEAGLSDAELAELQAVHDQAFEASQSSRPCPAWEALQTQQGLSEGEMEELRSANDEARQTLKDKAEAQKMPEADQGRGCGQEAAQAQERLTMEEWRAKPKTSAPPAPATRKEGYAPHAVLGEGGSVHPSPGNTATAEAWPKLEVGKGSAGLTPSGLLEDVATRADDLTTGGYCQESAWLGECFLAWTAFVNAVASGNSKAQSRENALQLAATLIHGVDELLGHA